MRSSTIDAPLLLGNVSREFENSLRPTTFRPRCGNNGTVMTSASRESLANAIAAEEARLAALDRDREDVRLELERLRGELIALDSAGTTRIALASSSDTAAGTTSSAKVALFRSLFRRRDDVYPKLWENKRTGKKGYAPACTNEWVRGVCEKPRVKCGDCPQFSAIIN